MEELWKDIPGYEGLYQASNLGRIRTVEGKVTHSVRHGERHWHSRILKQKWAKRSRCSTGHRDARVQLYKDKQSKTYLVARLVAMAWCDGYEEGLTVNHIDNNPSNNRADNLEWVTIAENVRKGFETGAIRISTPITLRSIETGEVLSFPSMQQASVFLGKNHGYIHKRKETRSEIAVGQDGSFYHIAFNK